MKQKVSIFEDKYSGTFNNQVDMNSSANTNSGSKPSKKLQWLIPLAFIGGLLVYYFFIRKPSLDKNKTHSSL